MALALYNVLQKFLTHTSYYWTTGDTKRSTISIASLFNHTDFDDSALLSHSNSNYWNLLYLKKLAY